MRLTPYAVQSDDILVVSEWRRTVRHPGGVKEFFVVLGKPPLYTSELGSQLYGDLYLIICWIVLSGSNIE